MYKKIGFACFLSLGAASPTRAVEPGSLVWRVETASPVVALTFDDGPGPDTPRFLALLKEYNAQATFFMLGELAESRPQTVRDVVSAGHVVASHLYRHENFAKTLPAQGRESLARSMEQARTVLEKISGQRIQFLRMPHGIDRPWIRQLAREQGFVLVNWSFGFDWEKMTTEEMTQNYLKNIQPGAIILMHDGGRRQKTLTILRNVLTALREKGYNAVTLNDLFEKVSGSPRPQPTSPNP